MNNLELIQALKHATDLAKSAFAVSVVIFSNGVAGKEIDFYEHEEYLMDDILHHIHSEGV